MLSQNLVKGSKVQYQDWDSTFFGFKIADYTPETHNISDVEKAIEIARAQDVSLLVYRAPKDVEPVPNLLITRVDRRQTYKFNLGGADLSALPQGPNKIEIYNRKKSDLALENLIIKAGKYSRFFTDPIFPRPAAIALYRAWARASVSKDMADVVFVTRDSLGTIVGVGTGRIDDAGIGIPSLMAIDNKIAGKGFGRSFVFACMKWLQDQGATEAKLITQDANKLASNTYTRMGWKHESFQDIFHIWIKPPIVKTCYI